MFKLNRRKAQVSIELTIIISVLFVIFILVFVSISYRSKSKYEADYLNAKRLVFEMSTTINQVITVREGTSKQIFLPNKIAGKTYEAKVYPQEKIVTITWDDNEQAAPIITNEVSGNLVIPKGYSTVVKRSGGVVIE